MMSYINGRERERALAHRSPGTVAKMEKRQNTTG